MQVSVAAAAWIRHHNCEGAAVAQTIQGDPRSGAITSRSSASSWLAEDGGVDMVPASPEQPCIDKPDNRSLMI
jgi:hypothetical protein